MNLKDIDPSVLARKGVRIQGRARRSAARVETMPAPLPVVGTSSGPTTVVREWGELPIVGVSVRIDGMRLKNTLNSWEPWYARSRRERSEKAGATFRLMEFGRCSIRPPCVVTLTRIYAGQSKPIDEGDGLNASFKMVRDAVAEWLGTDDGPKGGLTFRYSQERGESNSVVISVEPAAAKEQA